MDGRDIQVGGMCGVIGDAADEAAALHHNVDVGRYEELDATAKGVDIDFLVLGDDSLAQVQPDASAESIEAGTVEGFAMIDILVAAIVNRTANTLSILTNGQRALQPLVGIATVAVDDQMYTHT